MDPIPPMVAWVSNLASGLFGVLVNPGWIAGSETMRTKNDLLCSRVAFLFFSRISASSSITSFDSRISERKSVMMFQAISEKQDEQWFLYFSLFYGARSIVSHVPTSSDVAWGEARAKRMVYRWLTFAGTMWIFPESLIALRSFWFNLSEPLARKQTKPSCKKKRIHF